jgi:DNA modification methylase
MLWCCVENVTWLLMEGIKNLLKQQNEISPKQWPPAGIKPYYCDNSVCIIHGDCREIVPQLGRFDLLLTDPPYGDILTRKHGHGKLKESAARYGGGEWDVRPTVGEISSLLRLCSVAMIWGGNYFSSELPDSRCWLVWDKCNGDSSFADAELCWTNLDAAVRMCKCSIQSIANRAHPTQKPERIITKLMEVATNRGDKVFDGFMGVGTTARVAKKLGRKFIGVEQEQKFYEAIQI